MYFVSLAKHTVYHEDKKPQDKKSPWWRKGEELQNNSGPNLFERFGNWLPKKRSDMSRVGVIVTQSRLESKSSLTLNLVNFSIVIQIGSLWENEIFGFLRSRKHSFFWHFWGTNCPHFSFHVAQVGQPQHLQLSGYAHDQPGQLLYSYPEQCDWFIYGQWVRGVQSELDLGVLMKLPGSGLCTPFPLSHLTDRIKMQHFF